jgi:hypothetical protein
MQSVVMFGKLIINVSTKLKRSVYFETKLIIDRVLIIRDTRSN